MSASYPLIPAGQPIDFQKTYQHAVRTKTPRLILTIINLNLQGATPHINEAILGHFVKSGMHWWANHFAGEAARRGQRLSATCLERHLFWALRSRTSCHDLLRLHPACIKWDNPARQWICALLIKQATQNLYPMKRW